jgi:hypothetical protein
MKKLCLSFRGVIFPVEREAERLGFSSAKRCLA